jgi:23S rRNA (cytidine1920-2'-O)/16S rRNA (cytidine1409-2'-O)-methyltransferase
MVDGAPATKAGSFVKAGATIEVEDDARFVSRGGVKLEKALDVFGWSIAGLKCIDVGASTGGFTDCLRQRGAAHITALDVGYGQIAWELRTDSRVTVIERCNFRHADPNDIGAPFDFACADVSFISLTKLAPQFRDVLAANGRLVVLVKPQFEAGKGSVGSGGVVRDRAIQTEAIETVAAALDAVSIGAVALTYSPITGPAGNIEFLIGAQRDAERAAIDAAGVVAAAHEALAP